MKAMFQTSFSISHLNFCHSDLFRILRQGSGQVSIFEFRISPAWIHSAIKHRSTTVVALSLVLTLVGCASAPSRFYTLSAAGGTAKNSSDISVAVGPVSIPAVVDRPQIVISIGPNQVRLDEFNRWALPLQNNIARVIAENLTAQLGTPRVTVFPELTSADADYRAIIDVQRFDSMPGEAATLEAMWMVRRMKDGKAERGRTTVRQSVPQKEYAALAAAHSQAIARLSQEIADAVRSLDRADKS
jgi:uncharacterized protein